MRTTDDSTRALAVDLHLLMADYWNEIDANNAKNATDFFTTDCEFAGQKGHAGVRAFYDNRAKRGQRTTRHTFSNLRVEHQAPERAKMWAVVVNYGADGPPPITDFLGASLVTQLTCECVRDEAGVWRFALLRSQPLFIGKEPYTREQLGCALRETLRC